ncbi:asparaginase domain-containing protein [Conchiformibius kuhniae]|uniref:Asparaginase domain-containing protein n=1 Tax=Conchiformibius kuhniae TaxID=211502 RepID=A0ABD8B7T1_9NEIS|nr:asparaginase domain-containing protein [Conchiformibius kuhniae]
MKNIFVLYTGGSIGMTQSPDGLRPDTAIVHTALQPFAGQANFHWHICNPLIDSSAVSPQHWGEWLGVLERVLPEYDGVLVLHGTDTLAYTANVFALSLNTLGKPVVLTGAQIPFGTNGSDAPNNLATAVAALLRDDVREVLLAFNGKLFPAVGSSKTSTLSTDSFTNAHFGEWSPERPAPAFNGLPRRFDSGQRVAALLLTPGIGVKAAAHTLRTFPLNGAVLMTYGHGNSPADIDLLDAIHQFTSQNDSRLVLNISQVPAGQAAAVYAQGSRLRASGAVNGGYCNVETATALLRLAAGNGWTAADVQQELQRLNLM